MKSLKRISAVFFSIAIAVCFSFMVIPFSGTKKAYATDAPKTILIGSDYIFNVSEKDDFTPFDFESGSRMEGKSWSPQKTYYNSVDNIFKYDLQWINFSSATEFNLTESLYFWVYFSNAATRPTTFYLADNDGNYIKWSIKYNTEENEMDAIFGKVNEAGKINSASEYDKNIYLIDEEIDSINEIPYGWNLVELKIEKADYSGAEDELNKSSLNTNYTFTKFGFKQDYSFANPSEFGQSEVLFYNIYKSNADTNYSAKVRLVDAQDNAIFIYKSTMPELSRKYYSGEYFDDIPSFNDFFLYDGTTYKGAMWIGKNNYLKSNSPSEYENYFKIEVYNSTTKTTKMLNFGEGGLVLEAGSYTITYRFYPNYGLSGTDKVSKSDLINLFNGLSRQFTVSSYGKGIWFVDSSFTGRVGETYDINYNIDSAFFEKNYYNEVTIEFSEDGILELVDHNTSERKITVKCLKEGKTDIKLILSSLRLKNYSATESLENSNFTFTVESEPEDPNRGIRIALWTCLGVFGGGSIAFIIYKLVKSRGIEVK